MQEVDILCKRLTSSISLAYSVKFPKRNIRPGQAHFLVTVCPTTKSNTCINHVSEPCDHPVGFSSSTLSKSGALSVRDFLSTSTWVLLQEFKHAVSSDNPYRN